MSHPKPSGAQAQQALHSQGWFHATGVGAAELQLLLDSVGETIWRTAVRPKPTSKALVTSLKALDVHTDHHKADYIAWHCLHGDDAGGGQSVLVSAEEAFGLVDDRTREALSKINLLEHKVFPDDPEQFPLVSDQDGRRKFYYSFWLADRNMPAELQEAMNRFREAIAASSVTEITLRKDDVLIVDNGKMLHGRRAIQDGNRHLERYWLARHYTPQSS